MALPSARVVRLMAMLAIVPTAVWAGLALTQTHSRTSLAYGPLISAHADVQCVECHVPSRGTVRQQVQAQVRYAIGLRQSSVDFGYSAVTSEACLSCHARPNERHPIYRFREPRFAAALVQIDARSCLGCHTEHSPMIVSAEPTFCKACHEDLRLKNDPIDVAHDTLIEQANWASCLRCHDFHGNHRHVPPLAVRSGISEMEIRAYFSDGPDPFGARKYFEAKAR